MTHNSLKPCGFLLLLAVGGSVGCAVSNSLVTRFRDDRSGQGQVALALARRALEHTCRTREPFPLPQSLPPLLKERGAVFVSAMVYGKPRCCMGTLTPLESSLAQEIITNACAAAAYDKRFPPVRPTELDRLRVILSIIGDTQPITNLGNLNPLHDGLAVRGSRETGVVLPGETDDVKTMVKWGRVRAGVKPDEKCQYLRLEVLRFIEAPRQS